MQMMRAICIGSAFVWCVLTIAVCGCQPNRERVAEQEVWSLPIESPATGVWFLDAQRGYAVGGKAWNGGFICKTLDGGLTWQIDTLLNNRIDCIRFDAQGNGYACGLDGLALFKPHNRAIWEVFANDWRWHRACHFRNPYNGVIVSGEGYTAGQIRVYQPRFWIVDTLVNVTNELNDVWMVDSLTICAAGVGSMLRSTDGGQSWTRQDITGDFFQALHFPNASTGYCCGLAGTLLKTTDKGKTWKPLSRGRIVGSKGLKALWFKNPDEGYLAGENGLFWRTTNGGIDWSVVAVDIKGKPDFTSIFALENRVYLSTENGKVFYFNFK